MTVAIVLSTLGLSASPVYAEGFVTFSDSSLEAAVAARLGVPTGSITEADMDRLTTLSANWQGIQDLTGLEYAHNLTYLALQGNQISDLTPLASLPRLSGLVLSGNQVSDLAPLAGVTSLSRLVVENNAVSDLTPLAGLTSLTELRLMNDQVVDLAPLAGLHNLLVLDLTGNGPLAGLSPLADLTSLTQLYLKHTGLSDPELVHLSGLSGLTRLDLDQNGISGLGPLATLANLQDLFLNGNEISDVSPLAGLTSLRVIYLRGNEISDISALVANLGLASGSWVDVEVNHLDTTSGSPDMTDIGALQARGVTVIYRYQTLPNDVTPPVTTATGADSAWHNQPVTLAFAAQDNAGGSGVAYTEFSTDGGATWTRGTSVTVASEGTTSVSYRSVDNAANVEAAHVVEVKIDTTAPAVTFGAPADGAVFVMGQAVTVTWSVSDSGSGVEGTQPIGTTATLDTGSLGAKTFTVSATDMAGNTASYTLAYTVAYTSGGLMQPVNGDGSSIFKLGSNVPFKFALRDAAGLPVSGLAPRLFLALVSGDVTGTEMEAISTGQADAGNTFREVEPGQYQFNLSTKGMQTGYWRVRIDLGSGAQLMGNFSLR